MKTNPTTFLDTNVSIRKLLGLLFVCTIFAGSCGNNLPLSLVRLFIKRVYVAGLPLCGIDCLTWFIKEVALLRAVAAILLKGLLRPLGSLLLLERCDDEPGRLRRYCCLRNHEDHEATPALLFGVVCRRLGQFWASDWIWVVYGLSIRPRRDKLACWLTGLLISRLTYFLVCYSLRSLRHQPPHLPHEMT